MLENIEKGQTQEGANVLAYLLAQDQAPNAIKAQAEEAWDNLATWICPSVLYDAKYFGSKFILEELMSMILPEYTQA